MIFYKTWLLQARINIIEPLRGFNCGGDNLMLKIFATNIYYKYLTSTKSSKII